MNRDVRAERRQKMAEEYGKLQVKYPGMPDSQRFRQVAKKFDVCQMTVRRAAMDFGKNDKAERKMTVMHTRPMKIIADLIGGSTVKAAAAKHKVSISRVYQLAAQMDECGVNRAIESKVKKAKKNG